MSLHGGDIYRNKVDIDFSVNISPYGIPDRVRALVFESLSHLEEYPDPEYEELIAAVSSLTGEDKSAIVCGNGATELLYAVVRAVSRFTDGKRGALLYPCFQEYDKALHAASFNELREVYTGEDFMPDENCIDELLSDAEIVILGNPNNPTGCLLDREWLSELIAVAEEKGTFIVLDESFIDFAGMEYETIYNAGNIGRDKLSFYENFSDYDRIIRIRSFTKCMAMPGIRLGYCIINNPCLKRAVLEELPEWNVSVMASYAGIAACSQMKAFYDKVLDEKHGIKAEREYLQSELTQLGLRVFPSDVDFILFFSYVNLYDALLDRGILIRDCSNFKGLSEEGACTNAPEAGTYYRAAVKSHEDNRRLIEALREITTGTQRKDTCYTHTGISNRSDNAVSESLSKNFNQIKPADIERASFDILTGELLEKGIVLEGDTAMIIKRCIHTQADFEYANTLAFSKDAVTAAKKLIREGAHIVTDTNMALAGINKKELAKYGGEVHCFMSDNDIAREAKERGVTRASVSMEYASKLDCKLIFAVGNAPTALITLCNLIDRGVFVPDFVIGVPVGFVNVEQSKEMIMKRNIPYIVNRGRKGGSNIAAAICNAILYEMRDT